MTTWALIRDDVATDVTTIDPAGRYHPSLVWVVVPDGTKRGARRVNGVWSDPPSVAPPADNAPSLERRKAGMAIAIDEIWSVKNQSGFSYDFGGEYGVLVLQTRETDLPFWLALAQVASIQISMGQGGASVGAIRSAENVNVPVTASQALTAMLSMQQHLGAILAASWALKDAVAAAADHAALDAIDIDSGWPAIPN